MAKLTEDSAAPPLRHVIIVGAGFAGVSCARTLASCGDVRITLIDRNNYQQFQPLLYQVGTGLLSPSNAAFNLRAILQRYRNIDIKMSEIVSVDLANRTVCGRTGDSYKGDYLVLAAGGEVNFFATPGAEQYAYPLYSLQDAEKLRSRLMEIIETSELSQNTTDSSRLQVVIIGSGATGVETAGALADFLQNVPNHFLSNFDLRRVRIILVNAVDMVLAPYTLESRKYALHTLEQRGVEMRLGVAVKQITQKDVLLSDGSRLSAQIIIWAGGIKASALSASMGITPGRGGRIDIEDDLSIVGFPRAYALGDFANFKDANADLLPQLGSVALQAGKHCARNITAVIDGRPQQRFRYFDKGIMAIIGRNAGIAEMGRSRMTLTGFPGFVAWLGVHLLLLTTMRSKLLTLYEWLSDYFGKVHVNAILDRPKRTHEQYPVRNFDSSSK